MLYNLYLGSMRVGCVVEKDSDFPNLRGRIAYDEAVSHPSTNEERRLVEFLELDRESMRLIDVEHEQDVADELSAINAPLEKYQDLIETDDWYLVDEQGSKHPIRCPVLRESGEIVWRWNPQL